MSAIGHGVVMFHKKGQSPDEPDAVSKETRSERRDALIGFLRSIQRSDADFGQIDDNTDLVQSGLADSLAVIQIIMHLEKTYDVDLSDCGVDPAALGTIGGILDLIDREAR